MGVKRPSDNVDFQELPCKHSRQLHGSEKCSSLSDVVNCYGAPGIPYVSGEGIGVLEKYYVAKESTALNNGSVDNMASTLVSCNFGEQNVGSGKQDASPHMEEYFEHDYPRRAYFPFKDDYSSLLDRSPSKQVPIGLDHQASNPSWSGKDCYAVEDRLLGTTVIPMPDLSAAKCDKAGQGRQSCKCLDTGSSRCVQQHIMEAREQLRRTLGNEKFVKLGFCHMGEEAVARRWSDEEEQAFHDVVYSYPVSLGRKFWKHLSEVFPSRRKRELVSYYFNVFILRRRATQNRTNISEIDSDDDEWHASYGSANDGTVEEDSVIDPVEDGQAMGSREYSDEDNSSDDDSDGDDYVGYGVDGGMDYMGESYGLKLANESEYDTIAHSGEKISGCHEDGLGYQDDSCLSFEFQPYMQDSCDRMDAGPASGIRSQDDISSDVVGHGYLLEPCGTKVWARLPMDPMKGIDLLPTWSMIEDIFDQGMYKVRNDEKAPDDGQIGNQL